MRDARSVAAAWLPRPRVVLTTLYVSLSSAAFSSRSLVWSLAYAPPAHMQDPRTPVSPPTKHTHSWFAPSLKTGSILRRTRHSPLTHPSPQSPCLTESASYSPYPDSRRPYPEVYNPPVPALRSIPPQEHQPTDSFTVPAQTASVHDRGDMGSLSLLQVHATARPDERGQGLEEAKEDTRVEDEVMDEMTHSQSHSQPTSLDTLLSVSNGSGAEPIPRPVSAPPVFPHSGLESDRHDVEEEAAIGSMSDLRDNLVGCVPFYCPRRPCCPVCLRGANFVLLPATKS